MMCIEADVGRRKAGQYADIIAVSANPAQDIAALRTIRVVMKCGTIYRDDR
jgi:imidazolonepropionase-like amidohydrolase